MDPRLTCRVPPAARSAVDPLATRCTSAGIDGTTRDGPRRTTGRRASSSGTCRARGGRRRRSPPSVAIPAKPRAARGRSRAVPRHGRRPHPRRRRRMPPRTHPEGLPDVASACRPPLRTADGRPRVPTDRQAGTRAWIPAPPPRPRAGSGRGWRRWCHARTALRDVEPPPRPMVGGARRHTAADGSPRPGVSGDPSPQGSSTVAPTVRRPSSARWASATRSSGKRWPISTRTTPPATTSITSRACSSSSSRVRV